MQSERKLVNAQLDSPFQGTCRLQGYFRFNFSAWRILFAKAFATISRGFFFSSPRTRFLLSSTRDFYPVFFNF